jgi:hypothetical protein
LSNNGLITYNELVVTWLLPIDLLGKYVQNKNTLPGLDPNPNEVGGGIGMIGRATRHSMTDVMEMMGIGSCHKWAFITHPSWNSHREQRSDK